MDASGFERTVVLTPDMGWEVDVFGMPILDTVLRNQQVGRLICRLRTHGSLCPACCAGRRQAASIQG